MRRHCCANTCCSPCTLQDNYIGGNADFADQDQKSRVNSSNTPSPAPDEQRGSSAICYCMFCGWQTAGKSIYTRLVLRRQVDLCMIPVSLGINSLQSSAKSFPASWARPPLRHPSGLGQMARTVATLASSCPRWPLTARSWTLSSRSQSPWPGSLRAQLLYCCCSSSLHPVPRLHVHGNVLQHRS